MSWKKKDRWHDKKTEPPRWEVHKQAIETKIVLEYWVFFILKTFVKQEK